MTKHGLIETIKSVFGHHIDPEKHEEFKETNNEMEEKAQTILKLIKEKDEDSNQEPLVELVEDFFKHYQTLYARYDHLTGELRDKVHAKKSKDGSSSSSSSDSDSDHSPRKKGTKNGKSVIEFQKIAESVKRELEAANLEIAELKKKIEDLCAEKDSVLSEKEVAMNCVEEERKISQDLKHEKEAVEEKLANLISTLNAAEEENKALSLKTEELSSEVKQAQDRIEELVAEISGHKNESTTRIRDLELNLDSVSIQKSEIEKQKDDELSSLVTKLEEKEKESSLEIQNLMKELETIKVNGEKILEEKEGRILQLEGALNELQKKMEDGENEASVRSAALVAEVSKLEHDMSSLSAQKNDSETQLEKQVEEISDYLNQIQSLKDEVAKKIVDQEKTVEEKNSYVSQLKELEQKLTESENEVSSLHKKLEDSEKEASDKISELKAQIGKCEEEISSLNTKLAESGVHLEKTMGEISEYVTLVQGLKEEKEVLQVKIVELEALLVEKESEISSLQKKNQESENEATARITALTAAFGKMEAEISSLNAWKSESEPQLEKQKGEISDFINLAQELKEEKAALEVKIAELEAVLVEKGSEISSLHKKSEDDKNEASDRIMLMTAEIGKLEAELSSLNAWKSESESQLEKQKGEISDSLNLAQDLKEEKAALEVKISELEAAVVEKGIEISSIQKRTEDGESEASGRILVLTAEIGKLEAELSSLHSSKTESESELEKQKGEISDYVILVQDLKEEMAKKNADEIKFIEEKEAFVLQVKQLEDELKSVQELKSKSVEEKDLLQSKILELEALLVEKENDISSLQKKTEDAEIEASVRITALTAQISSLNALKTESESELEKQKGEISDNVVLVQALKEENKALEVKVVELEAIIVEKENEISSLQKKTEDNESDASGKIMALTGEIGILTAGLSSLKTEFEAQLEKHKGDISDYVIQVQDSKEEMAKKIAEVENLMQEKEALISQVKELEGGLSSARELKTESEEAKEVLQGKILGLEAIIIEKEKEFSSLQKKSEDAENEGSAQIAALKAEVAKLEAEITSLNALKTESESLLENQKGEISDNIKLAQSLKEENEVLRAKVAELEAIMEEKVNEISTLQKKIEEAESDTSGYLIEIENLKEQLENKGADERKLQAAILETETILTERGTELSFLQKKSEEAESQVSNLQEEINSLVSQKTELQSECEKKSGEISEFVILVDNLREEQRRSVEENENLVLRVKNLEKEVESLCNEKNGFEEQVKNKIMEIDSLQRKVEEVKNESHIQIESLFVQIEGLKTDADTAISHHGEILKAAEKKIEEMEETIEDLKGDVEIKAEEISTLVENVRNLEVKIRLSNQKLRITEQMLSENEGDHKNKESKLHLEHKSFEERIAALNGVIATYKATQFKVKAEIDEKVNNMFIGIDTLTVKFEEDYGHIETCICEILKELQIAKNLVRKTVGEKERLERELQRKESEKENLKKSVKLLEEEIIEKDAEMGGLKENLNEKDRGILGLGEEKKEAIRQLCIWIEYHRSRCDDLKDRLSKTAGARRQIRA